MSTWSANCFTNPARRPLLTGSTRGDVEMTGATVEERTGAGDFVLEFIMVNYKQ